MIDTGGSTVSGCVRPHGARRAARLRLLYPRRLVPLRRSPNRGVAHRRTGYYRHDPIRRRQGGPQHQDDRDLGRPRCWQRPSPASTTTIVSANCSTPTINQRKDMALVEKAPPTTESERAGPRPCPLALRWRPRPALDRAQLRLDRQLRDENGRHRVDDFDPFPGRDVCTFRGDSDQSPAGPPRWERGRL